MSRSARLAVVVLLASATGALGSPTHARARGTTPSGEVTVAAASSLTEAFTALGKAFEREHPAARVTLDFGSSATLATQVEQGAPVDVFASADSATMARLVAAGALGAAPVRFARNRLEIAVEPGNPQRIRTLADTVRPRVRLVLCASEVPCGVYARRAYRKAGVPVPDVPTGLTAKDTLSKVALGEADAAVVYVTDVEAAAGDVDGVAIAAPHNVIARYPIAVVDDAGNPPGARAFVRFVRSGSGQAILRRFGFLPP